MKKEYKAMEVKSIGAVGTVINKSGCWNDNSGQHDGKSRDSGKGNGGRIC